AHDEGRSRVHPVHRRPSGRPGGGLMKAVGRPIAPALGEPARRARDGESGVRRRVLSALGILAVLALWQGVILVFKVPRYIAPAPLEVAAALRTEAGTLAVNAWPTIVETL